MTNILREPCIDCFRKDKKIEEQQADIERLRATVEAISFSASRAIDWDRLPTTLEPTCIFEYRDENGKANPMATEGYAWCQTHGFDCPNLPGRKL